MPTSSVYIYRQFADKKDMYKLPTTTLFNTPFCEK